MAEVQDAAYLSIGEVLGLLLEDFPDVTISKIRFLESQGLISPERTASGYRKFYEPDVELLRVILTEQKSNYLPLRVIKDRLETGEIDPTGEHHRPDDDPPEARHDDGDDPVEVPVESVRAHPAAGAAAPTPAATPDDVDAAGAEHPAAGADEPTHTDDEAGSSSTRPNPEPEPEPDPAPSIPGVLLDRAELCATIGMTDDELDELESFGIVVARDSGARALYGDDAVAIARPACEFLRAGIDARHLRNWRTSAEREASLYEQLVTPRFRQKNPESHRAALAQLQRLDALGADLRAAMTAQALRRHFEH